MFEHMALGVGSSESLIPSTSKAAGAVPVLEGCQGNASPAVPKGLSRCQPRQNRLPAARHSANPRHGTAQIQGTCPGIELQLPALGKAGGISQGRRQEQREKQEPALSVPLLLSESPLLCPRQAPALQTCPPKDAIVLLTHR